MKESVLFVFAVPYTDRNLCSCSDALPRCPYRCPARSILTTLPRRTFTFNTDGSTSFSVTVKGDLSAMFHKIKVKLRDNLASTF
jgi:hypothetical protein